MISVRSADVLAWTQPMAIFVGDIIPVNQLNPFSVCCDEVRIELYDTAYSVRSVGANSKLPNMRPDTNSAPNQRPSSIGRRWRLTPPHLPLQ
jgi:hypothetical protein